MLSGPRLAIDRALERFLASAHEQITAIDGELTPISSALNEFLAGGKRLRPLFATAGFVGAGGSLDDESIYRACVCLELLQACALIHDDMMDGSDTRRGAPSMHRRFEREHSERRGFGDSENFGHATALLLGDLALVWSTQALNLSGLSDLQLRSVNPIFDIMRVELMAGQYLDMHGGSLDTMSIESAIKIATYNIRLNDRYILAEFSLTPMKMALSWRLTASMEFPLGLPSNSETTCLECLGIAP
jgi:geranylgeranyl diphosphate synthase type I